MKNAIKKLIATLRSNPEPEYAAKKKKNGKKHNLRIENQHLKEG